MDEFSTALREGNEGTVLRLLDADPALLERAGDFLGNRPLAKAAERGHLGLVRLLIERGANLNGTGATTGFTAVHWAAQKGHVEVVTLLLSKGAHADIRIDGVTPLMWASGYGRLEVVKVLVQHMRGQGLDERTEVGMTALHFAACMGHEEVVRFLLFAGADPTITNNEGRTPRALAEETMTYSESLRQGRARCVAVLQVRPLAC
jgi:ankyrin repeat protein